MTKSRMLIFEELEPRMLRAAVSLPWTDPEHLTLSFAPDGTMIDGAPSQLFQDLNAQFPSTSAWENVIVSAFQTWAAQTNLSIGLVADQGQPFGVAGLTQGDPRFGDIRIGARPLSPEVMSVTVPPDPFMSGTLSGDMILNSSANLNPSDLFDVALHEAGLALGLVETNDPSSVMYPVISPNASLDANDVQNIQALYGTPVPDPNDNTIATAKPISEPLLYTGTTPLVAYGDLTGLGDTDFYAVQPPLLYSGSTTIQLQTSGISFMQPQVQVFGQNFQSLGVASSTSETGDIVTVQLSHVNPAATYFIEVSSPATNVFGIGRYALSVTYNGRSVVSAASLPAILRGPYDSLSAGDVAGLLSDVGGVLFQNGIANLNVTFLTAEPLSSEPGYPASSQYRMIAGLNGTGDVDMYRVQAPQTGSAGSSVLTVSLAQMPANGMLPVASVYDQYGNLVSSVILLNGTGTYVIQATGLNPGEDYYVDVAPGPDPSPSSGNYAMTAAFGLAPAVVQSFATETLSATDLQDQYTLYVAQTQVFQFVLSTGIAGMSSTVEVSVEITNSSGAVVFQLIGNLAQTVSGASVVLTPGPYTVSVSVINTTGAQVPAIAYHLTGGSISDPIGPAADDPADQPMYPCADDPAVNCYCFPDGTYSTTPYEFSSTSN
jgi:predicted Zn-dependent protease